MVGCNSDMGCALLDHRQNGSHHSMDGPDFLAAGIQRRRHGEKVPEQFEGAVDQVNVHGFTWPIITSWLMLYSSPLASSYSRLTVTASLSACHYLGALDETVLDT